MVLSSRILVLANTVAVGILDQEGKVHRNNLLFPTGDGIRGGADGDAGHIVGSGLAVTLVSVDDNAAAGAVGLTAAVDEHLSVQDHVAQRLADQMGVRGIVCVVVPAQGAVGSGNDVTVSVRLGIGGVGGDRLNAIVTGSGDHLLVTGDDLGVGIVEINLQHVGHLTKGTGLVVQDDLRFLNTGSQFPVALGDEFIVIIGGRGVIIINTGCQGGQRHHAENHNCGNHKTQKSSGSLHAFSPFFGIFIQTIHDRSYLFLLGYCQNGMYG